MKLPRWLVPWRKADQNTVTPIRPQHTLASKFGTIFESFGGSWQRGMVLASEQNMLAFSAVYACVSLIAGDISKLRWRLMERRDSGIWTEVADRNSPFLPVLRKPNRYQTRSQFMQSWVISKLLYGNAYILLERDQRRVVTAMYPLDPRAVTPLVASDGEVYYQLNANDLAGVRTARMAVPASEIIHDLMNALYHPLCGVSPIYSCASSATQGIRIQANSETFFRNMSRPSGMLTATGHIPQETIDRLKTEFEQKFSGSNVGRMFVAGDGLQYEAIPPIAAQDAQLIEQLKWTVEDVARAFGVPLYKISAGAYPNLTNIGALNQDYYNHTVQPHIVPAEELLDEKLGLSKNGLKVDIDENDMLRMDPLSRAEIVDKYAKAGVLCPNEARADEGRLPVAGGDTPYLQEQNYSLAALAKRDAKDDPFATEKPASTAPTAKPTEPNTEEAKAMTEALIRKLSEAAVVTG